MEEEKIFQVAISLAPKIGGMLTKQLISHCGSAQAVFKSTKHKLGRIPGIGSNHIKTLFSKELLKEAEIVYSQCLKNNIDILSYTDKKYPKNLKQIYDAPAILYTKGNVNWNCKIVSIVGTRKSTSYGKNITRNILKALSQHEVIIVSGLAYGIDISAHKAAISNQLPTVGVMANGLDIVYPSMHTSIANDMVLQKGGLLSEYAPGVKPDPRRFPARNRIIAGLCDALIVVEAAKKGGALITAEIANSYNKDIFAVPGNLDQKFSEGCNTLIQDHKAHIYTDLRYFEGIMGWDENNSSKRQESKSVIDSSKLTDGQRVLLAVLEKENRELLIDEISWQTQIPINKIASMLLHFEFEGIVQSLPGKKYKLCI
ncbi:DNA-processing protein DprA [Fulvivirgaceae bacterium BMA10]|uniref:DNA-processing protein DprA n=1 Tax=Splendidivirga corallicola TaxID=3051826 RepID=A0ABT8KHP3_9BACT|nr:DNA-processing protein DprA [Fulvivirgaceae bacterium BMA10]